MVFLNITPRERLTDAAGRPYFAWDSDLTLAEFQRRLQDADPQVRGYFAGKLMRQARPDDVFAFLTVAGIGEDWAFIQPHLGASRDFWTWILTRWGVLNRDGR